MPLSIWDDPICAADCVKLRAAAIQLRLDKVPAGSDTAAAFKSVFGGCVKTTSCTGAATKLETVEDVLQLFGDGTVTRFQALRMDGLFAVGATATVMKKRCDEFLGDDGGFGDQLRSVKDIKADTEQELLRDQAFVDGITALAPGAGADSEYAKGVDRTGYPELVRELSTAAYPEFAEHLKVIARSGAGIVGGLRLDARRGMNVALIPLGVGRPLLGARRDFTLAGARRAECLSRRTKVALTCSAAPRRAAASRRRFAMAVARMSLTGIPCGPSGKDGRASRTTNGRCCSGERSLFRTCKERRYCNSKVL